MFSGAGGESKFWSSPNFKRFLICSFFRYCKNAENLVILAKNSQILSWVILGPDGLGVMQKKSEVSIRSLNKFQQLFSDTVEMQKTCHFCTSFSRYPFSFRTLLLTCTSDNSGQIQDFLFKTDQVSRKFFYPWPNVLKPFMSVIYEWSVSHHPSLMFLKKAEAYPSLCGAPIRK